jgi:hypothetical protein
MVLVVLLHQYKVSAVAVVAVVQVASKVDVGAQVDFTVVVLVGILLPHMLAVVVEH